MTRIIRMAILGGGWAAGWILVGRFPSLDDFFTWRFYVSIVVLTIALAAAETMGERKGR